MGRAEKDLFVPLSLFYVYNIYIYSKILCINSITKHMYCGFVFNCYHCNYQINWYTSVFKKIFHLSLVIRSKYIVDITLCVQKITMIKKETENDLHFRTSSDKIYYLLIF